MTGYGIISIENNGIASFTVKSEHATLRSITFVTNTDRHDDPVRECERSVYRDSCDELEGQIFILNDLAEDMSSVFILATPDCVVASAKIENKKLIIKTHGYPVSVGHCRTCEADALIREWYRMFYMPRTIHAMSNTWGDRNGRERVNDSFIRREIESGADLGLDVVQIDDGWQKGIPEIYDENGRRVFEGDFWQLKRDIFPNGIKPLSEYARERGVELGLWFAPHSREVYEHYERDISVLRLAYNDWGVRYFKLDMLSLPNVEHCYKTEDFLDEIFSFGNDVSVELDVTADKRLGFLASAPYGTIFVENRYTAWKNYYPHRTMRNLWLLSKYIPASKLQFELLNPELNKDKYGKADPFCPSVYDIDYLFASVMVSNPLFWMETQFLSETSRVKIKGIMDKWRKYREELTFADVTPIGQEPTGKSFSGFMADMGNAVHLVLFRESTDKEEYSFKIGTALKDIKPIHSNSDINYSINRDGITVKFGKIRSYAWIKGEKA